MIQPMLRKNEKPLFTIYSKVANQSFSVIMVDAEGKKIPKSTPQGGHQYLNNRLQYLEESYQFLTVSKKTGEGLSVFPVYADTPKNVAETVLALAKSRYNVDIMTEEAFEESENPQRYKEKVERMEAEKSLREAKAEVSIAKAEVESVKKEADSRISEMQKRLEALETKKTRQEIK